MGRGAGKGSDSAQWMPSGDGGPDGGLKKITMEEVKEHRTPADAWMVYKNKVYDVSGWKQHPGGNVIFTHAGDDFTDIFAAFHPPSAYSTLAPFCIGELDNKSIVAKPKSQREFEQAYRDLRGKLYIMGMYNASPLYYLWKCGSQLALWGAACACVLCFESVAMHFVGALLLAVFWQQCGWLAHDFLHHQVFKNRYFGDMAGVFWGNVAQGFSTSWWKTKHNAHHAVPNLHESCPDAHDGDPDMDTMPLLAWSVKMASQIKDCSRSRWIISHQMVLYFPILFIARISWLLQSFGNVFSVGGGIWATKGATEDLQRSQYPVAEKLGLIVHYCWLFGLMYANLGLGEAVLFFLVSECVCGLLLALVFGLGHNGMATYDAVDRPDFWKLQVTTTRNVTSNWFVDWFCGGLQYQVDHHLFPQIPRHNLPKTHAMVKSFCKEWEVHYHEAGIWQGTWEVLTHLDKVATEFITEFPAM